MVHHCFSSPPPFLYLKQLELSIYITSFYRKVIHQAKFSHNYLLLREDHFNHRDTNNSYRNRGKNFSRGNNIIIFGKYQQGVFTPLISNHFPTSPSSNDRTRDFKIRNCKLFFQPFIIFAFIEAAHTVSDVTMCFLSLSTDSILGILGGTISNFVLDLTTTAIKRLCKTAVGETLSLGIE